MRLEVPFYKQTTNLNCGPTALKMVLAYFGKDVEIRVLEKRTGIKKGKGITTIQIAIAAVLSGHRAEFFSKHVYFNEENLKLDFYKKYSDEIQQSKKIVDEARKIGVKIEERAVPLKKILGFVSDKSVPIILLDWNVILKKEGYLGHFVPIVGYDKEHVYIHNQGFDNPTPFLKIKKDIFEKARKSKGTDEDVIIIHK